MTNIQNNKINNSRIEICGGIASGKSTLASFSSQLGIDPIYESFQSNPFWEAFYTVPVKYNFETEICFMLQHYHQIKKNNSNNQIIVCDYSFLLDIAYAEMGLNDSQFDAFMSVYKVIERELPPPAMIIHLQCDAETELSRIRKRGRVVEESINSDFLNALNNAVSEQVSKANQKSKIITIDSAKKNFADDVAVRNEILQQINREL